MANRRLDLSGKEFGHIKVLNPAGISSRGATLWSCLCGRCGSQFVAAGYRLTAKKPIRDCGCAYRERCADLSGKSFGALLVLERDGAYPSGDVGYLCRCECCGNTKRFPSSTIRSKPKSCGCVRLSPEQLTKMSPLGVAATVQDGVQVYSATREKANANSSTGCRWAHVIKRKNGDFIYAAFDVRGKRYYRGGFESPESAHAWALEEHRRILLKEGIERPAKRKDK